MGGVSRGHGGSAPASASVWPPLFPAGSGHVLAWSDIVLNLSVHPRNLGDSTPGQSAQEGLLWLGATPAAPSELKAPQASVQGPGRSSAQAAQVLGKQRSSRGRAVGSSMQRPLPASPLQARTPEVPTRVRGSPRRREKRGRLLPLALKGGTRGGSPAREAGRQGQGLGARREPQDPQARCCRKLG